MYKLVKAAEKKQKITRAESYVGSLAGGMAGGLPGAVLQSVGKVKGSLPMFLGGTAASLAGGYLGSKALVDHFRKNKGLKPLKHSTHAGRKFLPFKSEWDYLVKNKQD